MNRGQIKELGLLHAGGDFRSASEGDPFHPDDLLNLAADEIAGFVSFYTFACANLVAGQADYQMPNLSRPGAVMVKDENSKWRPVTVTTADALNRRDGVGGRGRVASWRNLATQRTPDFCIISGENHLRFVPAPSTNVSCGYKVEGWGVPGNVWAWDSEGDPLPLADTQECPLPTRFHTTVADRYALLLMEVYQAMYEAERYKRVEVRYARFVELMIAQNREYVPAPTGRTAPGGQTPQTPTPPSA